MGEPALDTLSPGSLGGHLVKGLALALLLSASATSVVAQDVEPASALVLVIDAEPGLVGDLPEALSAGLGRPVVRMWDREAWRPHILVVVAVAPDGETRIRVASARAVRVVAGMVDGHHRTEWLVARIREALASLPPMDDTHGPITLPRPATSGRLPAVRRSATLPPVDDPVPARPATPEGADGLSVPPHGIPDV